EARASATPIPAFARPVVFLRFALFRFEVGELHLFPQPIDDVVDAKFQRVLDAALLVAALARLLIAFLRGTPDAIAGLRLALADAFLLGWRAQAEPVMLEHPHRDSNRAGAAVQHIRAGNDLRQMLPHGVADFVVMT